MEKRIWRYITSSISFSIVCILTIYTLGMNCIELSSQVNTVRTPIKRDKMQKVVAKVDTIPLLYDMYLGADLFGVGSKLFGSNYYSSEVSFAVNLKNRFIPTLEVGVAGADGWSDTGIHYVGKTSPYFRIGLDINTMSKSKNKQNFLYGGLRYGISSYTYDVSSLSFKDPLWQSEIHNPNLIDNVWKESTPYNFTGLKGTTHWIEIVLGVKIQVYKSINMGWALRMKYKGKDNPSYLALPQYIPGYGRNQSNIMGVTYSIIYKLPSFKKKKKQ